MGVDFCRALYALLYTPEFSVPKLPQNQSDPSPLLKTSSAGSLKTRKKRSAANVESGKKSTTDDKDEGEDENEDNGIEAVERYDSFFVY